MVLGGCGSSSSTNSGLPDNTKALTDLSLGEKQALCDWIAQQFGGYDSRGLCVDSATGGLQGPVNQSGCIDQLRDYTQCSPTVGDLQFCVQAETQNACDWATISQPSRCRLFAPNCGQPYDAQAQ